MSGRGVATACGLLALIWAGTIFWLSSQSRPLPALDGLFGHDKLLHLGAYALLGALVRGALGATRLAPWPAFWLAVAVATGYGASDEWHQSFVPSREADVGDLLVDAAGAALGAGAAFAVLRRSGPRASIPR